MKVSVNKSIYQSLLTSNQLFIKLTHQPSNTALVIIALTFFYIIDQSKDIKGSFEKFASDNKGIFRIGAVSCVNEDVICSKEKIDKFPTIKIYPQFPAPTFDLDISGD